jgi:hypothetical protein
MSPTRVTIDPEGDTLIVLKLDNKDPESNGTDTAATTAEPVTQTAAESAAESAPATITATTADVAAADVATQTVAEPEKKPPVEKRFLCSKKHLTLASRRAMKIFSSNFREASKEDDGLYHWIFEAIFSP